MNYLSALFCIHNYEPYYVCWEKHCKLGDNVPKYHRVYYWKCSRCGKIKYKYIYSKSE
jgi:hypothetical protein